ncbi:hypothetical protein BJV77DRAFT_1039915, partial [Russula vinacea]
MAIILWVTKIERKKDASGRSIPLDLDSWVDVGLVAHPVPSNSRSHYVSRRLLGCLH